MCLNSILLIFYYGLLFAFYGFDTFLCSEKIQRNTLYSVMRQANIYTHEKIKRFFFRKKKRVEEKEKKHTKCLYTLTKSSITLCSFAQYVERSARLCVYITHMKFCGSKERQPV